MSEISDTTIIAAAWEAWEGPHEWARSYGDHVDVGRCGSVQADDAMHLASIMDDDDVMREAQADDSDALADRLRDADPRLTADETEAIAAMVAKVISAAARLHAIAQDARDASDLRDLADQLDLMGWEEGQHGDEPSAQRMRAAAWDAAEGLRERIARYAPAGYEIEDGDLRALADDEATMERLSALGDDVLQCEVCDGDGFDHCDRIAVYREMGEDGEASASWSMVAEAAGGLSGALAEAIREDWCDRRAQSLIDWVEAEADSTDPRSDWGQKLRAAIAERARREGEA